MLAMAPTPLVDKPSGFPFVVARLPAAPVTSLSELPYSRTMSPQVRDVFAMLGEFVSTPGFTVVIGMSREGEGEGEGEGDATGHLLGLRVARWKEEVRCAQAVVKRGIFKKTDLGGVG